MESIGDDVECYPVTFKAFTRVHRAGNPVAPQGVELTAYLFVPKILVPTRTYPAIVFLHGSGSMFSSGRHNVGLNSKHLGWINYYTGKRGYVSLHVDSYHSRYVLPDTPDAVDLDATIVPSVTPGGDDYFREAQNNSGLDPNSNGWSDSSNGRDGVSEILERPYDAFAGYDFLTGRIQGTTFSASRVTGETLAASYVPSLTGVLTQMVPTTLRIDPRRVFLYGTSHGGQSAMAAAHEALASDPGNPMGAGSRFAGVLDFYGGCGLFSAFGGSGPASAWRPAIPFLMIQGEMDTTIWGSGGVPMNTRSKWDAEDCGERIRAARSDTTFQPAFLESIVYAGARHDFESVERDDVGALGTDDPDFPDWRTKVHSNQFVAVPFMEAIQRMVNQGGSPDSGRFAELGLPSTHAMFQTIPYTPDIPPQVVPSARGIVMPQVIPVGSSVQLATMLVDPLEMHAVSFSIALDVPGFSITTTGALTASVEGSATVWVTAQTPGGVTIVPIDVVTGSEGSVAIAQGFDATASPMFASGSGTPFDLLSMISSSTGFSVGHEIAFVARSALPGNLSLAGTALVGDLSSVTRPATLHLGAELGAFTVPFTVTVSGEDPYRYEIGSIDRPVPSIDGPTDAIPSLGFEDGVAEAAVLGFTEGALGVAEGAGSVTVVVRRSGSLQWRAIASIATATGSAGTDDFHASSTTLEWQDGESGNKSVAIAIVDDGSIEGPESFTVTLSNPVAPTRIDPDAGVVVITIADGDEPTVEEDERRGGGGSLDGWMIAFLAASFALRRRRAKDVLATVLD